MITEGGLTGQAERDLSAMRHSGGQIALGAGRTIADQLPIPEWQARLLDERLAAYRAEPKTGVPADEVFARLLARYRSKSQMQPIRLRTGSELDLDEAAARPRPWDRGRPGCVCTEAHTRSRDGHGPRGGGPG